MANEFRIRNGFFSEGNSNITGSLNVTAGITGSLQGTASFAVTASHALNSTLPAGSTGWIQFKGNSGAFDSTSEFVFNKTLYSLANGKSVSATGNYSHAEGNSTTAIGDYSHAEGSATITVGQFSHAEGGTNRTGTAAYSCSITLGIVELSASYGDLTGTYFDGTLFYYTDISTTIGSSTYYSIVTGSSFNGTNTIFQLLNDNSTTITSAGIIDVNGDILNIAGGYIAHAEGDSNIAIGDSSHAEGQGTATWGNFSHAEGQGITYGEYSHAEGSSATTYGNYSHAEGNSTTALGDYSHAEGAGTFAGYFAYSTTLIESGSIAFPSYYGDLSAIFTPGTIIYIDDTTQSTILIHEVSSSLLSGSGETKVTLVDTTYNPAASYYVGLQGNPFPTYADERIGNNSHAEGNGTTTLGDVSHADGLGTTTHGYYQTVVGQYNAPVLVSSSFVIGNGESGTPSNLLVAYGNNVQITGSLTVSGSSTFRNIGLAVFTGSVIAQAVTGSFTGSFTGNGAGLTGVGATEYIRRSDYTSSLNPNVNYLYAGYAPVGSAEATLVWNISRLAISASGATLTQTTSSAAWTNRYSYTYL